MNKIKINNKEYKIYPNCKAELINGYWYMINNFTGTKMAWETGSKKIRA